MQKEVQEKMVTMINAMYIFLLVLGARIEDISYTVLLVRNRNLEKPSLLVLFVSKPYILLNVSYRVVSHIIVSWDLLHTLSTVKSLKTKSITSIYCYCYCY
jgi:hypothetical protein